MQLILLSNKLHATTRMERCGPGEHNFVTVVTRFRGVVVHFRSFYTLAYPRKLPEQSGACPLPLDVLLAMNFLLCCWYSFHGLSLRSP